MSCTVMSVKVLKFALRWALLIMLVPALLLGVLVLAWGFGFRRFIGSPGGYVHPRIGRGWDVGIQRQATSGSYAGAAVGEAR